MWVVLQWLELLAELRWYESQRPIPGTETGAWEVLSRDLWNE